MRCYKCNSKLSNEDFCSKCGTDVTLYKKIAMLSNSYYNEGLEKAQVRDLSGAIYCLTRSVKLDKSNIEARNLLGLVYFEMGEVVDALREWIISKNIQPEKNVAETYINEIQKNQSKLETMNQTIKKYNQALIYANQDSDDLAIIQLKKVLSTNKNLVRGYHLLALLYIKTEEYDKALKTLNDVKKIDKNNTLTMKYLNEIEEKTGASRDTDKGVKIKGQRKVLERKDIPSDSILPKTAYKEYGSGKLVFINIVMGILLGVALMSFLVLPAYKKTVISNDNQELNECREQLASKTSTISSLEEQIATLQASNTELTSQVDSYAGESGIVTVYSSFIGAIRAYLDGDNVTTAQTLSGLDLTSIQGDNVTAICNKITAEVNKEAFTQLYDEAYANYRRADYAACIPQFTECLTLDPTSADALYYLARSYQNNGDDANARTYFKQLYDNFPDSVQAADALEYYGPITDETTAAQ